MPIGRKGLIVEGDKEAVCEAAEALVVPVGASRLMASGVLLSTVSRILVTAAGAATTVVVARLLGTGGVATYAVAQSLLAVGLVLTTLGVEHGIVYYASSGRLQPATALRTSQLAAATFGLVCGGLVVAIRFVASPVLHGLSVADTVAVAAAAPLMLSWFLGAYVALAVNRWEGYALPSAVQATACLALTGLLGALGGVTGVIIGLLASHAVAAAVQLGSTSSFARRAPWGDVLAWLRRAIAFGVKGYGANALQVLNLRIDLLILSAVSPHASVGQYSVAVSVTSVVWLLPQALSDILYPRAAALGASERDAHAAALSFAETKSLRHGLVAVVVVGAVAALALLGLVVPVYGASFRPAIVLGLILVPGAAALGLAAIMAAAITGRGHPGLLLIQAIVVTPPTIVMYALLIPLLHATGAALASTASYMLSLALTSILFRRVTGENPLRISIPTRDELADYRELIGRVLARTPGLP